MTTLKKTQQPSRSQIFEICKPSENSNPNLSSQSPLKKPTSSPVIGSAKSKKSAAKNPIRIESFQNRIQERRFVVAKKNSKKCPRIAYESLRASQEDFFRSRGDGLRSDSNEVKDDESVIGSREEGGDCNGKMIQGSEGKEIEGFGSPEDELEIPEPEEIEFSNEAGSSKVRKIRNRLLEEARNSIPEPGSGRVKHLVKAFESILSIPNPDSAKGKEGDETEERKKAMKWALPGLQPKATETEVSSSSSFLPGDIFFGSKNFDKDSRVWSSIDSSTHESIRSRTSGGSRRSRRSSIESSGRDSVRKWEKQLKVTSQKPFKLRTEQRGSYKKEEFHKKVVEMVMEEKKQRIPIAQGLPWTTDEPECLVKPPVKESTRPIDLILHSDVRAVERAEFDHHVAEKLTLMEQYRLERERQQKLEEEEEIRRLRRELVPRAQPMPYFDRPFIPKRSLKHPTIPKEPKFHNPQHKKIKCLSWNDINSLYHQH
ncbi:hypothetical protein MRB53_011672 [Persea americana]|uniref:Uncharacterized protein n=1 Tax=Persea americana TaxID=3435 RepID=A0ACC2LVF5_PERAE|nr:hypothetical protein MRB53_011672 [Persea americana]